MKTILFDTDSGKIISPIFENGYLVDDQPQPVDPPIFELEYKPTPMPPHDSETEAVSAIWIPDTILKTYTQVWEVRKLTNEELEARAIAEADATDQQLDPFLVKKLMKQSLIATTEEEKKEFVGGYPSWRPNESVVNQTDSLTGEADIRQWKGKLYRCIQSHTTQMDWMPDKEQSLWGKVGAKYLIIEDIENNILIRCEEIND